MVGGDHLHPLILLILDTDQHLDPGLRGKGRFDIHVADDLIVDTRCFPVLTSSGKCMTSSNGDDLGVRHQPATSPSAELSFKSSPCLPDPG